MDNVLDIYLRSGGTPHPEVTQPRLAVLAHFLRTGKEIPRQSIGGDSGKTVPIITQEFFDRVLADEFRLPSPLTQSRRLLRLLGDRERSQGTAVETEHAFAAEIGAVSIAYVLQYLEELRDLGWLRTTLKVAPDRTFARAISLTIQGWQEWEQISEGHRPSDRGFIAMQFNDEKLDKFVEEVIKPGVKDKLGLIIERVDDYPEAGIIDNRMRQLIQDSAFVIADLTHGNSGAYWEAGYAEGLGKPVIYLCEKATFEKKKPHFDVNHCMTVMWSEDKPDQTIDLLTATIRNSLPKS